jgi:hypothetical protein
MYVIYLRWSILSMHVGPENEIDLLYIVGPKETFDIWIHPRPLKKS